MYSKINLFDQLREEIRAVDLEKMLYLPTKLTYKIEICYVHLIETLDILLVDFNFSASLSPWQSLKCGLLAHFFPRNIKIIYSAQYWPKTLQFW